MGRTCETGAFGPGVFVSDRCAGTTGGEAARDEPSAPRGGGVPATDAGQAVLFVVVLVGVVVVGALVLSRVAQAAIARAEAQAAADAVALAGAVGGRAEAERVATANDAALERYEADGLTVFVVVRRRGVVGRAAAEAVAGRTTVTVGDGTAAGVGDPAHAGPTREGPA